MEYMCGCPTDAPPCLDLPTKLEHGIGGCMKLPREVRDILHVPVTGYYKHTYPLLVVLSCFLEGTVLFQLSGFCWCSGTCILAGSRPLAVQQDIEEALGYKGARDRRQGHFKMRQTTSAACQKHACEASKKTAAHVHAACICLALLRPASLPGQTTQARLRRTELHLHLSKFVVFYADPLQRLSHTWSWGLWRQTEFTHHCRC